MNKMNLVVVESPTKARTITKFLGDDYTIKASMGHIMDLPKSKLGVDVEHDFAPQYESVPAKAEVVSDLKKAAKGADKIILATDPDREGEAIASHVRDVLSASATSEVQNSKFSRIVFHEITKEAIDEALKNPRDVDENLVNAQTARRVLDRLVGYKLSPLLWKKVRRGLSAGRVQSVALRLIVEREREIEKFKKEKYFTINSKLKSQKSKAEPAEFELIEINGEKIEEKISFDLYDGKYQVTKTTIRSVDDADKIISELSSSNFAVENIEKRETKRSPLPPFTTSTLQQEASRRFGFSGKRTMSVAQKLYEEGFITYHRTDSVSVATAAVFSMRSYAEKEFGKNYVPEKPRFYKTRQKLAQEAHEAIRPTNITVGKVEELGRDHEKLYDLIFRRAVASQMADAVTESTAVFAVTDSQPNYRLKANGSVLVFPGFLKINPQALSDNLLPDFSVGDSLTPEKIDKIEHETPPPPRYNDASLIATLEEKGIGRPSTYATIIGTIEERQYVEREDNRFKPTSVGIAVNDFLVENFSTVDDIPFTAEMEDKLDSVATGSAWVPVIREFYTPFEKILEKVEDAKRVKIAVEETNEKCPQCGSSLVVRVGRFGKFLACSAFPNCRFTKPFISDTGLFCPKCGSSPADAERSDVERGKIVIKKTKRGRRFYGCSNYPACDFAAWKLSDIKKQTIKVQQ